MSKFAVLGFVAVFLAVFPLTLIWSACCMLMFRLSPSDVTAGWRVTLAAMNIGIAMMAGALVMMTLP